MNKSPVDFFNKEAARSYDERNSKLSRISACLHQLIGLTLKDLPANAKILCAGVGTGAEILYLAQVFPNWKFVALDPSNDMLSVCRQRLEEAGVADRCEFVHAYVHQLAGHTDFDAALSILVAHFVKREERLSFYNDMTSKLRPGGFLINAEISFDLDSKEFPAMLKGWEAVQEQMGANAESLAALPKLLREALSVISPEDTEELLRQSGISLPLRFFQAMMICGWSGQKK